MTYTYTYRVLRYVHDVTTGEFMNVGVVVYAAKLRYLGAICQNKYGRLSKVFPDMKAEHFKSLMRYIQNEFEALSLEISQGFQFETHKIEGLTTRVLPVDDSSIQWSPVGSGLTDDPAKTLENLFERMVQRYDEKSSPTLRSEDDVWRHFKQTLEVRQILRYFAPRTIAVKDDEIQFSHTAMNGLLHCVEPLSFDLTSTDGIKEKAHRWLGRITSVQDAPEKFKVYFVVAPPRNQQLVTAFNSAVNILGKVPVESEVTLESQAEALSDRLQAVLDSHAH